MDFSALPHLPAFIEQISKGGFVRNFVLNSLAALPAPGKHELAVLAALGSQTQRDYRIQELLQEPGLHLLGF